MKNTNLPAFIPCLVLYTDVKGKGYSTSIITSMESAGSREVLNGKVISLREQGKGKMKRKADSISDEDAMRESGVLGHSSPKSLNQTIFFQISLHFGTRGCQEHHQINMEDLKIGSNPMTGEVEYVEWVEGITKTRQGGLIKQQRRVPQRMLSVGGPKCPIVTLQKKSLESSTSRRAQIKRTALSHTTSMF